MGSREIHDETDGRYRETPGLWQRVMGRVFPTDDPEEGEEPQERMPEARRRAALRLDMARGVRVAVRLHATVFNDARVAADGLKNGQQQIVNLERAAPALAERIIDFLSGVTYALDGTVERVGEKVYLFAPANVHLEVDGGSEPQSV